MLVVEQVRKYVQLIPILFKRVAVVHEETLWEMGLVTLVDLQYRADHPCPPGRWCGAAGVAGRQFNGRRWVRRKPSPVIHVMVTSL